MNRTVLVLGCVAFASLAVNLFAAGYLAAGGGARPDRARAERARGMDAADFTLRGLASGLPQEVRAQLREGLKQRRRALLPLIREQVEVRRRIGELLQADTLDSEALREAFAQQRRLSAALQEPVHETLVDAAQALDPDQRRALLARLQEMRRDGRRRRRDDRRTGQ